MAYLERLLNASKPKRGRIEHSGKNKSERINGNDLFLRMLAPLFLLQYNPLR
jgi:hypothetical protein